jgi:hypothetical protein
MTLLWVYGETKEAINPRRVTAVCICPFSGGGRLEYINWLCPEKSEGIRALREVLQ